MMNRRQLVGSGVAVAAASATGAAARAADNAVANKEIALGLSRAIMAGDWAKVDALLADDFKYVGDGAPAIDKPAFMGFMKGVLASAMTEMKMEFPRVVAEGEFVAVEYTNEMTHSGEFFGIPATGKRVLATGHFIRQIRNGKIVAEWQTTNAMGLINQLKAK